MIAIPTLISIILMRREYFFFCLFLSDISPLLLICSEFFRHLSHNRRIIQT